MLGILFISLKFIAETQPNTFGEKVSDITADGAKAADDVAKSFDHLWEDTLGGPLYSSIADVGIFFAVGALSIFMVQWAKAMLEGENSKALSELIWPILVIFLLGNHGENLASTTLELREIIQQTNQTILETTTSSVQLQEAYQEIMKTNGGADTIRSLQIQCEKISDPKGQQECYQKGMKQAEEYAQKTNTSDKEKSLMEQLLKFDQSVFQTMLRGVLYGFGAAFQWIVEVSLLLTALLGPLAVGGTLLPLGKKSIIVWLTAFFSVGMVKLCYNIICGLVATMMFSNNIMDAMVFSLIIGILAPVLSLALATGGGFSIINGMSNFVR